MKITKMNNISFNSSFYVCFGFLFLQSCNYDKDIKKNPAVIISDVNEEWTEITRSNSTIFWEWFNHKTYRSRKIKFLDKDSVCSFNYLVHSKTVEKHINYGISEARLHNHYPFCKTMGVGDTIDVKTNRTTGVFVGVSNLRKYQGR